MTDEEHAEFMRAIEEGRNDRRSSSPGLRMIVLDTNVVSEIAHERSQP